MIDKFKSIFNQNIDDISELLSDSEFKEFMQGWFRLNRWAVFFYIIFISSSMVFYVYNVLKINTVMADIEKQEIVYSQIQNKNKILISKVIHLQEADRICRIAEDKLKMIKNNKAPIHIK